MTYQSCCSTVIPITVSLFFFISKYFCIDIQRAAASPMYHPIRGLAVGHYVVLNDAFLLSAHQVIHACFVQLFGTVSVQGWSGLTSGEGSQSILSI